METLLLALLMVMAFVTMGAVYVRQLLNDRHRRRLEAAQAERDRINPPAVCQCGHPLALHTPGGNSGGGACQGEQPPPPAPTGRAPRHEEPEVLFSVRFGADSFTMPTLGSGHSADQARRCACQQYVGPRPYPEFHVPEGL